ncbi:probable glutathione S-transferase isoform X1 [Amaranthus tricolor]|uniref:probable glutathione S-transferase isoform X1 n=1 Tax=Amaranthus tricolor TaxID=29722 RepID=UPI0025854F61|nr:probable glutathione S-transferase isoform X1 [Amaranthus tricolor]
MSSKEEDLVLLDYWASPFVARVKLALEEKGITNYECLHEDHIMVSKSSLLMEMNPVHKKVPVLIHNGKPVCESLLIVEYIDEVWKHKSPSLMPFHPYDTSQARFWAYTFDKKFPEVLTKLWTQKSEIQQKEKDDFLNFLKMVEGELGDKPYFGGNTFGYCDIALISIYSWFYTFQKFTKLDIQSECPKLIAWGKRCMERDSVKKVVLDEVQIYNYALELRKKYGID